VIAAGDDHGQPDHYGFKTSTETDPERNLNQMAREEFEDISYQAIAMLCQGRDGFAEEIASKAAAARSRHLFVQLGNVIMLVGCEPLEQALANAFGREWRKLYQREFTNHPQSGRRSSMMLPAHTYLDQLGIAYQRRTFPTTIETGAASVARALGFTEHQMVKTLIFETDQGERVLIMLGGDQSAISGHLKKVLGSRNIRMASAEAVQTTTGYAIGSIPPFHWQPDGFRSFLDASLLREPALGVGAGRWGEEIILTPEDLVRASRAQIVNLTHRNQPVFPDPSG
jgi:Cys-tRNA(Pro)/Cys-tRNA(Cys) deacylase